MDFEYDEDDIYANTFEERYTLRQYFDSTTKHLVVEDYYNDKGQLHRVGAPAYIRYDRIYGHVMELQYFQNDKLHRENGPACISIDPQTKIVTSEHWYKDGEIHRTGGLPAVISRDRDTGEIYRSAYYENGNLTREDIQGIEENKLLYDVPKV